MIVNKNIKIKHYRHINFPYDEMETLFNYLNADNKTGTNNKLDKTKKREELHHEIKNYSIYILKRHCKYIFTIYILKYIYDVYS